jgi:hypothetical protein
MRVANAPSGAEDLPDVGLVVAVGVPRTACAAAATITAVAKTRLVGRLVVGEHGELVGQPSPLVSSDPNPVVAVRQRLVR